MPEYSGVLALAEAKDGGLTPISLETIGCGRRLADALGENLGVMLVNNSSKAAGEAIRFGADKVYMLGNTDTESCDGGFYLLLMESTVKQLNPRILLMGHTDIGQYLAPSLAFRLGLAATTDCVGLEIDPASRQLLATRPVYGGNALATFAGECLPQIDTLRAKAFPKPEPDASRQGEIIQLDIDIDSTLLKIRLIEKRSRTEEGIRLEDADVIVAGGRGIGSSDGFKQLEELASVLKGAIGATRPPCDNGWVPSSAQIGLTGKIVAPELYIAVAISGTSQHTSGCVGSKNIVAINKDPEAPIFKLARLGVVGDWKKVLPAFTARMKELAG
jgi:electron transfer flavoprotein alpha subunit